ADERDRRALRIHLTDKGTKLIESLLPVANEFNDNLEKGLTKSERSALEKFFHMIDEIEA
ncbi:MAG TPA: hypothetical protein VIK22_10705, partial [Candidatus Anoxymicrobiaceae bacterium]